MANLVFLEGPPPSPQCGRSDDSPHRRGRSLGLPSPSPACGGNVCAELVPRVGAASSTIHCSLCRDSDQVLNTVGLFGGWGRGGLCNGVHNNSKEEKRI